MAKKQEQATYSLLLIAIFLIYQENLLLREILKRHKGEKERCWRVFFDVISGSINSGGRKKKSFQNE